MCTVSGTTATFVAAGTCTITASQPGNSAYSAAALSQSFSVAPHPQTITSLDPIADLRSCFLERICQFWVTGDIHLDRTSRLRGIRGQRILSRAGTCTIVASQGGNSAYAAATSVSQSFMVVSLGQTLAVTFTVPNGVALGTPIVFTEGVPSTALVNPDFTLITSATTCTGSVTGTCTVGIQFTPQQSGLRRGAVKLVDSNLKVLATSFISGIGPNSLTAWASGASKTIYAIGNPRGVAVNGAGNVFVVDISANQIFKVTPAGTTSAVSLGVTLNSPFGLALDAAGNLYIADAGNNRVLELPYGGAAATVLNVTGLNFPEGLTIDGAGNLLIANTRASASNGTGNIVKVAAGSGTQTTVLANGLSFPAGVVIDAIGDLFVADWGNNRVLELSSNGSQISIGSNLANASAVAVDSSGTSSSQTKTTINSLRFQARPLDPVPVYKLPSPPGCLRHMVWRSMDRATFSW